MRSIVDDVRHGWGKIPSEKREWFRLWAIDELPKQNPFERFTIRLLSGLVYAAYPNDVGDFLAEGRILREAILEKVAASVMEYTRTDDVFAAKYSQGMTEILAGKAIRVKPDEL
jgi:hypothetical protein